MRDHSGAPGMQIGPAVAVCTLSALPWSVVRCRIEVIRRRRLFAIFHICRLRDGNPGFLTAPKFIVGPFRSCGYANLTCNARPNLATPISRYDHYPKEIYQILGVWLDSKLVFAEHINKTVEKAEKTLTDLFILMPNRGSILMPNIGGPRASKRRLISSVMHSQIIYAAPVFSTAANNVNLVKKLNIIQRLMAIRISSAYRTISGEAAGVIAGIEEGI
ncbi:hypothetical protein NQ317_007920 [Molorchus minor]|uniref:Uncharacterized protein n=1 Tax=Molorchus minor TaxID=1323400 RepID=A0ABQ9JS46_9CUCU|nr:hypothetical protein NQ317_007920 [Molorchus minor]